MGVEAFDLAERLQTPGLRDERPGPGHEQLDGRPVRLPGEARWTGGRCSAKEDLERLGGFARYRDVDGDGIGWRTLPGTDHPRAAYFARGTGHDEQRRLQREPGRLRAEHGPAPAEAGRRARAAASPLRTCRGAGRPRWGIIAYGSSHHAVVETRAQLREEARPGDRLPARARLPVRSPRCEAFVAAHRRVYVVEQNRDAQMLALLKLDLPARALGAAPLGGPRARAAARCTLGDARRSPPRRACRDHPRQRARAPHQPPRPVDGRVPRGQDHPLRGLRPQRHLRADPGGHVRPGRAARAGGQALRDRLLLEEPGLLHGPVARLQRACTAGCRRWRPERCWPTAPCWRWGCPATATPPPSAWGSSRTHAAQPAHGLRHRGQRRVRADQGPVLGHRRRRRDAQDRRGERPAGHRHLRPGHPARGELRGPLVLGRQAAALGPAQGGPLAPRHRPARRRSRPASPSTTTRAPPSPTRT